jgi:hypothetical protein
MTSFTLNGSQPYFDGIQFPCDRDFDLIQLDISGIYFCNPGPKVSTVKQLSVYFGAPIFGYQSVFVEHLKVTVPANEWDIFDCGLSRFAEPNPEKQFPPSTPWVETITNSADHWREYAAKNKRNFKLELSYDDELVHFPEYVKTCFPPKLLDSIELVPYDNTQN